ncbi:MAG: hypothetical protein Q8P49_03160 [Candidatus Liptonbacteria bacterium]|nr:hypothetical protein [Candidatus Liptonbacteria bacterium]
MTGGHDDRIAGNSAKKKRFVFSLISAILIVVIAYALLEFFTRIVIEQSRKDEVVSFYRKDDLIAQSLKPGSESTLTGGKGEFSVNIKTTAQGFRDAKIYQVPKPANTFRILMLGDSFTFGHGVEMEQTFSKVLEKSLNEKYDGAGKSFEVINAGYASGFTWDEHYLFLKERGLRYQPDLVVVNAWAGNDLTDILGHEYPKLDSQGLPAKIVSKTMFVDSKGFLETKPPPVVIRIGVMGLKDHINAFCYKSVFCKIAIWPVISSITREISSATNPDQKELPPPPPSSSPYFAFLKKDLSPNINTAWETGQKILLAANDVSVHAETAFMIVNIPVREEVYDPNGILRDTVLDSMRMEKFARKHSVAYCSPLASLKQASSTSYFPLDSHLTAHGHRLTAEAIEGCLQPILKRL